MSRPVRSKLVRKHDRHHEELVRSATYLDRLGHHWGRLGRAFLERVGWIREGMSDDDMHAMSKDKLQEHIDLLTAEGALDWFSTPQIRQQVFIEAWIRGFNKLSR